MGFEGLMTGRTTTTEISFMERPPDFVTTCMVGCGLQLSVELFHWLPGMVREDEREEYVCPVIGGDTQAATSRKVSSTVGRSAVLLVVANRSCKWWMFVMWMINTGNITNALICLQVSNCLSTLLLIKSWHIHSTLILKKVLDILSILIPFNVINK